MRLSEAFNEIEKIYLHGAVEHYAKYNPDPWQQAHEELNSVMLLQKQELTEAAVEVYFDKIKSLLHAYAQIDYVPKKMSIQDAFVLGNELEVKRRQSQQEHDCLLCRTKENLTLYSKSTDSEKSYIICKECLPELLKQIK